MSSSGSLLKLLLTNPSDFRTLLQFKLFYESKRDLTAIHEHSTSGWDRRSMRRCWDFLDMTSRSFAAVIKELDGDLARVVSFHFSPSRGSSGLLVATPFPSSVLIVVPCGVSTTTGLCFHGATTTIRTSKY